MALISKTTAMRKDMDNYGTVPCDLPPGVQLMGEVMGYIRCAELVHRRADEFNLWTSEQDGSLLIRDGYTGMQLSAKDKSIKDRLPPKAPKTYIYSMAHIGDEMWLGLSDGNIRVVDMDSVTVVHERRKHSGSINCIHSDGTHVYTGGDDFQIFMWEAESYRAIAHFSGHFNRLRCFAAENL